MEPRVHAKTSLLQSTALALREAYGTNSIASFMPGTDVVTDYEPVKLSSFRVCCVRRGTIISNPVLFVEQFLLTCVFGGFACLILFTSMGGVHLNESLWGQPPKDMSAVLQPPVDVNHPGLLAHGPPDVTHWIEKHQVKMRQFCSIISGLGCFLMALYTSMGVGRWWTIRTQGVGGIKTATVDLEWTICQFVTQDKDVLSAIKRYGRASLKLIFLWRQFGEGGQLTDNVKEQLLQNDLLTKDEVAQLKGLTHCLHETIWAWQIGIVSMLRKNGLIKSNSIYQLLLDHCEHGRQAVQCAHTHLAIKIPMQYIHLLGFIVKVHNLILAVIMGLLFGMSFRQREFVTCCLLFGRTLILPFLFNALLLINADLSDPFEGKGTNDFPEANLVNGLDKDCQGFVKATRNMPKWIMARANIPRAVEEA
mmetsp:Transcript_23164/g.37021  ORF Transcript_23164/g.37021 Transcript_23164/m.37021 type:complete len:421 (+) Transcript_23164:113-1375(+)